MFEVKRTRDLGALRDIHKSAFRDSRWFSTKEEPLFWLLVNLLVQIGKTNALEFLLDGNPIGGALISNSKKISLRHKAKLLRFFLSPTYSQPAFLLKCMTRATKDYFLFFGTFGVRVDSIFILPKYQNRGLGAAAMKWIIETTMDELILTTREDNFSARKLYKKMGFRETKILGSQIVLWRSESKKE